MHRHVYILVRPTSHPPYLSSLTMHTGRFWGADVGVRRAPITPSESSSKNATPDPSQSLVEEDTLAWALGYPYAFCEFHPVDLGPA